MAVFAIGNAFLMVVLLLGGPQQTTHHVKSQPFIWNPHPCRWNLWIPNYLKSLRDIMDHTDIFQLVLLSDIHLITLNNITVRAYTILWSNSKIEVCENRDFLLTCWCWFIRKKNMHRKRMLLYCLAKFASEKEESPVFFIYHVVQASKIVNFNLQFLVTDTNNINHTLMSLIIYTND